MEPLSSPQQHVGYTVIDELPQQPKKPFSPWIAVLVTTLIVGSFLFFVNQSQKRSFNRQVAQLQSSLSAMSASALTLETISSSSETIEDLSPSPTIRMAVDTITTPTKAALKVPTNTPVPPTATPTNTPVPTKTPTPTPVYTIECLSAHDVTAPQPNPTEYSGSSANSTYTFSQPRIIDTATSTINTGKVVRIDSYLCPHTAVCGGYMEGTCRTYIDLNGHQDQCEVVTRSYYLPDGHGVGTSFSSSNGDQVYVASITNSETFTSKNYANTLYQKMNWNCPSGFHCSSAAGICVKEK